MTEGRTHNPAGSCDFELAHERSAAETPESPAQPNDGGVLPASRRRLINGCVAAYWFAMFVGTHIPNPEVIIGPEVSDKLLHFVAYFVLMTLLIGRLRLLDSQWPTGQQLVRLLLLVGAYAAVDELLQAVPGINRHADVRDAVADIAGAVAAGAVAALGRLMTSSCRQRRSSTASTDA